MKKSILLAATLLIALPTAYAAKIPSKPIHFIAGFLTGEEYLSLSETDQENYIIGVIDGFTAAPAFGAQGTYYNWLGPCLKERTNTQISAMTVKYLRENPETWNNTASLAVHSTLALACPE